MQDVGNAQDVGPLVACLKKDDHDHAWADARFRELRAPLLTCEAVLNRIPRRCGEAADAAAEGNGSVAVRRGG